VTFTRPGRASGGRTGGLELSSMSKPCLFFESEPAIVSVTSGL